jgi:hypothetical protein
MGKDVILLGAVHAQSEGGTVKRAFIACVIALGLAGCATPITFLKNPKTEEVATCGGGIGGLGVVALAGYSIEKKHDDQCVKNYEATGFIAFRPLHPG